MLYELCQGKEAIIEEVYMKLEYGACTKDFFTKSTASKNTTIFGYATVYVVTDLENDIISPKAIGKIDASKIKLLWQHDPSKPIGKVTKLESDYYGLRIEAEINNDTVYGSEASSLIKQGALNGLSIGFTPGKTSINTEGMRVIEDLQLYEVSVVTFPANSYAKIDGIKSCNNLSKNIHALKEYEGQILTIKKLVGQL